VVTRFPDFCAQRSSVQTISHASLNAAPHTGRTGIHDRAGGAVRRRSTCAAGRADACLRPRISWYKCVHICTTHFFSSLFLGGYCFVCPSLYFLLRTQCEKKGYPEGVFPTIKSAPNEKQKRLCLVVNLALSGVASRREERVVDRKFLSGTSNLYGSTNLSNRTPGKNTNTSSSRTEPNQAHREPGATRYKSPSATAWVRC
jgi:hypothetical protein